MRPHPKPRTREFCVALYSQGALRKQLVWLSGRTEQTIARWIRQAGAKRGHRFRTAAVTRPQQSTPEPK